MRFLLIDDSPAEREQLVQVLQQVYPHAECLAIHGRQDLEAAMAQGGLDAVLTEYQLSWTDGLSLLKEVQAQYPHTPVIMVTGSGSELLAVEGMQAGLSGYIPKMHLQRLPEALQHSVERARQGLTDITARRQREAQLRQAQKMQAISTLTGGIAHDFNNILTVILGYTELTLDDVPQNSQAWRNLKQVITASERAKALVQQMLTFSRQTESARQSIPLYLLVKETLTLLQATLPSTITLHHYLDPRSGPVLADPTQMHQVLINLCTNAEYTMRETGGVLTVALDEVELPADLAAARPDLVPGPYVRLTVCDTGPGMTSEMLERIFEPFFTTRDTGEGTGLGLAVVHGIVTNQGGTITVQSAPGQGATFAVYLPRSDASTSPPVRAQEFVLTGHECILFVDDEEAVARVSHMQLTRLGYDVVLCSSGQEALEVFRKAPEHFDLVITDQTMPQMTGETLARELRRIRPDIPIVLCTGFSHVVNAEQGQTLGLDAFCMKPLQLYDLGLIIRQVLARRRSFSPLPEGT